MQPQPATRSHAAPSAAELLILGYGPGLAIVHRSLLRQIRAQMNGGAISSSGEQLGLLLGPEPQRNDLRVKDFIPLEREYCFARSPKMLLAGIVSVQPMLDEARQKRSHTLVGLYRVLRSGDGSASQSGFEFLSANWKESSLSSVRCGFVFVCLSDSETSLRVYMGNGEHWVQIQEVMLQSEAPSSELAPEHRATKLNVMERLHPAEHAGPIAENIRRRGRLWFEVSIITLLLLLFAANTLAVRFVGRIQQEKVNLQRVTDQARVSTAAAVSKLPPPSVAPVPPDATASNRQPIRSDLPRKQASKPRRTRKLAIGKKPAMLKRSEAFSVEGQP